MPYRLSKNLFCASLAIAIAVPSITAYAADSNFYLDLQAFQSKDTSADGVYPGISVDNTDTGYGIGAGYRFNSNIAVEGGYRDFGKISATGNTSGVLYGQPYTLNGSVSEKADGFYLGTALSAPFTSQLEGVAHIGILNWDGKATATGSFTYAGTAYSGSASASDSGTDPYYGLGVNYKINETVSAGLDWMHYRIDGDSVDTTGVRLKYNF